jgi:hypothetical protein
MRSPTPPLVIALVLATTAAPPALATVNIEKYRLALAEDGAAGGVTLSIGSKTGNVDTFETSLSGTAGFRHGPHLLLGVVAGTYTAKRTGDDRMEDPDGTLLDSDARYANKLLGALRYNRELSERLAGELFTQLQYDEFLRMDLRSLGGLGLRLGVVEGETGSVHIGTGYMLELERQDPELVAEDPSTLAHRWTSYVCFSVEPVEGLTLSSTAYAQPRITDFSDYRLLDESALTVALGEHFSLGIAFTLRHDSDPALLVEGEPPLVRTDTELTNKLTIDF